MSRTYEIHYSGKQFGSASGPKKFTMADSATGWTGLTTGGDYGCTRFFFDGLSRIPLTATVTALKVHVERVTGGSPMNYTVANLTWGIANNETYCGTSYSYQRVSSNFTGGSSSSVTSYWKTLNIASLFSLFDGSMSGTFMSRLMTFGFFTCGYTDVSNKRRAFLGDCYLEIVTDEPEGIIRYSEAQGVYTGSAVRSGSVAYSREKHTASVSATAWGGTKFSALSGALSTASGRVGSYGSYGNWSAASVSYLRVGNYSEGHTTYSSASYTYDSSIEAYKCTVSGYKKKIEDYCIVQAYEVDSTTLSTTVQSAKLTLSLSSSSGTPENGYYVCCKADASSVVIPGDLSWCGAYVNFAETDTEVQIASVINYMVGTGQTVFYIMQSWTLPVSATSVGSSPQITTVPELELISGLDQPLYHIRVGYLYYSDGTVLKETTPYHSDGTVLTKAQ